MQLRQPLTSWNNSKIFTVLVLARHLLYASPIASHSCARSHLATLWWKPASWQSSYGAENWCLSQNSIQRLDSSLGEFSKRVLKLPRWYFNTPASGSARALCLTRKLNFHRKFFSVDHSETEFWHLFQMISTQSVWSVNVENWSNISTPISLQQFFNGKLHDTCPHPREIKILSRERDLRVWWQGWYVHCCWSGKGCLFAQTMRSYAGPWPKVYWWPQKLGEWLRSHPMLCLHAPCARRKTLQETLSFLTFHNSDKLLPLLLSVSTSDSVHVLWLIYSESTL